MAFQIEGPVLLLGHDGMLGRAFLELLTAHAIEHNVCSFPDFDMIDPASVEARVKDGFKTVINCTAFTDVDGAETTEERAFAVNARGVATLAQRCLNAGSVLVHFSTDYVFSGTADTPYPVDAPRAPQNAYGRSKALGEHLLEETRGPYLLLRTSWLYAPWANNFVRTMLRLGREREMLKVVDDQRGRPTSAEHLARVTLGLLERKALGTFHVTDGGECTWYDFAREIMQQAGLAARIEPCTSAEFPRKATRPAYSVLDTSLTEALVGPLSDWKVNLAEVLARLSRT